MTTFRVNEEIIRKFCETHMSTHTDWTGTRVETNDTCVSIDDFVNKLWNYLEEESDRMD